MADARTPFAHVLHQGTVRQLAGTPVYHRGERYFREGRVHDLTRRGGRLSARVRGTDAYEVAIWVHRDALAYACSCPFASDGAFCKHCVATALAWLDRCAESPSSSYPERSGNLLSDVPEELDEELFTGLVSTPGARFERIVSTGQATAPASWYDQPTHEWVLLLRGEASLRFEDEVAPRTLRPGDWIWIEAHRRHRVEQTSAEGPTVWLAVHVDARRPDEN